eukprot:3481287-Pyramimonas_sp.AAC.1
MMMMRFAYRHEGCGSSLGCGSGFARITFKCVRACLESGTVASDVAHCGGFAKRCEHHKHVHAFWFRFMGHS